MNEEQILEELIGRVEGSPGSHTEHLEEMAEKIDSVTPDLRQICLDVLRMQISSLSTELRTSAQAVRLVVKYLLFDLEATRRERDQLRTILEDQK